MVVYLNVMSWEVDENENLTNPLYSTIQFVYVDINGVKGPNKFGKNVFRLAVYFNEHNIKSFGHNQSEQIINNNCSKTDTGVYCLAKIMRDGWQIADDYPC